MGKIMIMFAGQGAQYTGMGKELYEASPAAAKVFDLCEGIMPGVKRLCFEGSKEEQSVTKNTQPCVWATDLACAAALTEAGVKPDGAAGFSLGEVAAVAFCGIYPTADAFSLVVKRGELMGECAQKHGGSMAAVLKLTNEKVKELCDKFEDVYPVNFNCAGQVSVAGDAENMKKFIPEVKAAGGRAVPLAVSGAFHSPFMAEASDGLFEYLKGMNPDKPNIPLYANLTAKPYDDDPAKMLSLQVKSPVLWEKTIQNAKEDGFDTFIEVGPGKVLSNLVRRILPDAKVFNIENVQTLNDCKAAIL